MMAKAIPLWSSDEGSIPSLNLKDFLVMREDRKRANMLVG
jgi:hypothetical protein